MKASYYFIINARIGQKKINTVQQAVEEHFSTDKLSIKITEYGGHAQVLAQEALRENYTHIIAVGGDGTVNEIIQVLALSTCILGIVPCGSGNGLARHASIPLDIPSAVKSIKNGHALSIDLGKVNDVYFISNAGVGIDALVCHDIKTATLRGLKMYAYYVAKRYFSYKPVTYTIQIDQEKPFSQSAFFLNIANGSEFGYGFAIAPEAGLQDGILDVILVKAMSVFKGIRFVVDGWNKKLIYNHNCLYFRGRIIKVTGEQLTYFQTDGDAHTCHGECIFEVVEQGLQLMVPSSIKNL